MFHSGVSKEEVLMQWHNFIILLCRNGTKIITLTGTPTLSALTSGVSSKPGLSPLPLLVEDYVKIKLKFSIKVNPNSTVSVTSVSLTLNQPVCVDTSIASITFYN